MTNDILLDEFGYSHSHCFLEWGCFHLMKYLVATRIQMYPFKGKWMRSMKPSPHGEDTSNLITQIKQLASSHATFAASPGTSSMICGISSLGNWAKRLHPKSFLRQWTSFLSIGKIPSKMNSQNGVLFVENMLVLHTTFSYFACLASNFGTVIT